MGWGTISPWKLQDNTEQYIAIGTASAQSTAFGNDTMAIRISATSDCHIRINQNPTALATDTLVKASDGPEVIKVAPGDKLAVIQDAAAGNLSLVELTY